MANRKSSITAELKLSGMSGFKSQLADVGNAAKKTGQQMQSIRPPDISMTPAFRYIQIRNQAEKAAAKARADNEIAEIRRVQAADVASRRIRHSTVGGAGAGGSRGGGMGGKGGFGGGFGVGGNLAVGYNAIQDMAQGGIAGIANNVPQIIQMVAASPALKMLGASVAAVASTAFAGVSFYNNVIKNTESSQANDFVDRRSQLLSEARARQTRRENASTISGSIKDGARLGKNQLSLSEANSEAMSDVQRKAGLALMIRDSEQETARVKLESIEDQSKRAYALAEFDKRVIEENHQAKVKALAEEEKLARDGYRRAAEDVANFKATLARTEGISLNPDDKALRNKAEGGLEGAEARQATSAAAMKRIKEAKEELEVLGKLIGAQKELIDTRAKETVVADVQAKSDVITQRRQDEADGEAARNEQVGEFYRMKRRADRNVENIKAEQEKGRQTIRDQIKAEEEKSGMSPRKRAKAEEEERKKARTSNLIKEGFSPTEAANIAGREEKLSKPRGNRIRGAGYGGEDKGFGGLGSEAYGGLDDLAAMQPQRQKREPIRGAGAKTKDDSAGKQETGWQMLIKAMQNVEKAVRDGAPNASQRSKPISTTSRA